MKEGVIDCIIIHRFQSIKSVVIIFFYILIFTPLTLTSAAETTKYGPTKTGDTLWKIAKANLPNKDISIEQFVYTLYLTNLEAFQSKNMNQLLKGVTLKIPDTSKIINISKSEAKKKINKLQANAKQLSMAQKNSRRFSAQVRKYRKQLRKYRRNSRAWRRTYQKLSRARKNLSISNRKIARFNKRLKDEANIDIVKSNQLSGKKDPKTESVSNKKIIEKGKETKVAGNQIAANIKTNSIPYPLERTKYPDKKQTSNPQIHTQSELSSKASHKKKLNWFAWLKENFILVGGSINGLILLLVLFKLFDRKEEADVMY